MKKKVTRNIKKTTTSIRCTVINNLIALINSTIIVLSAASNFSLFVGSYTGAFLYQNQPWIPLNLPTEIKIIIINFPRLIFVVTSFFALCLSQLSYLISTFLFWSPRSYRNKHTHSAKFYPKYFLKMLFFNKTNTLLFLYILFSTNRPAVSLYFVLLSSLAFVLTLSSSSLNVFKKTTPRDANVAMGCFTTRFSACFKLGAKINWKMSIVLNSFIVNCK